MPNPNDLTQGLLRDILIRLDRLEKATPMNNGAVGRSGFEVYDQGTINVSSGNLIGNGIFQWSGRMDGIGPVTFTGVVTVAGPLGITGNTTIQGLLGITGDTTVTGKLTTRNDLNVEGSAFIKGPTEISGKTTLKNDLELTSGGKITAGKSKLLPSGRLELGPVIIDPDDIRGPSVAFSNGSYLSGTSTTLQLTGPTGNSFVGAGADGTAFVSGTKKVTVTGETTKVSGSGTSLQLGANITFGGVKDTTQKANVYMDSTGRIFRSTAA